MLLSFRAAGRMLGICPRDTLPDLIRSGALKTVALKGRTKIPLGEVERVAREGIESVSARRKRRPTNHEAPLEADLWC